MCQDMGDTSPLISSAVEVLFHGLEETTSMTLRTEFTALNQG